MCPRVTLQLPAAKATLPWDAAHIESLDLSATLSEDDQRRTVGTRLTAMNISMAAMPIASLRRKLRGRRRPSNPSHHVLCDRGLADVDAELQELAVDAGRTPERVSVFTCRMRSRTSRPTDGVRTLSASANRAESLVGATGPRGPASPTR
jgi:hypothetical protein